MNHNLGLKVREHTREIERQHADLRFAYLSTVRALAEAIDAKDRYTRGHSERVGMYASRIAHELGCEADFVERVYLTGLLHDIGKIGVADAIISKPGKLNEDEFEQMKQHPEIGARILEPVTFLDDIAPAVRHHHEWYNGGPRGYPDGLRGEQIPLPSRILAVADTVEAMTADRPYRSRLPMERVLDEVQQYTGSQFDPEVAAAFLVLAEREEGDFVDQAEKFDIEAFLLEGAGRR
jgi:putative nucleotidyltransferase with HDIG domain